MLRVELLVEVQKRIEERVVLRSNGCVLQDLVLAIHLQYQFRRIEWVIFPLVYGLVRFEVSVKKDSTEFVQYKCTCYILALCQQCDIAE